MLLLQDVENPELLHKL